MIRKYGLLESPPAEVRGLFLAFERWAEWMPTVKSIRLRSHSGTEAEAEIKQVLMGFESRSTWIFEIRDDGFRQRQIRGPGRKWDARWQFHVPPDGLGTTISCEIDLDLGIGGWLTPRGMIQGTIDQVFTNTLTEAGRRLPGLPPRPAEPAVQQEASAEQASETLLELWQTGSRLELRIGQRRFPLGV